MRFENHYVAKMEEELRNIKVGIGKFKFLCIKYKDEPCNGIIDSNKIVYFLEDL